MRIKEIIGGIRGRGCGRGRILRGSAVGRQPHRRRRREIQGRQVGLGGLIWVGKMMVIVLGI